MADKRSQSYANHGRLDPAFHFFMVPILVINLLSSFWKTYKSPSGSSFWLVLLSMALLVMAFKVRTYALKVQDRVIRLEERLRLRSRSPEAFWPEIEKLSEPQLIALRFAPDEELAALARRAFTEKLTKDQIKKAVVTWRADHFRV